MLRGVRGVQKRGVEVLCFVLPRVVWYFVGCGDYWMSEVFQVWVSIATEGFGGCTFPGIFTIFGFRGFEDAWSCTDVPGFFCVCVEVWRVGVCGGIEGRFSIVSSFTFRCCG